jgi:hypothetical protein
MSRILINTDDEIRPSESTLPSIGYDSIENVPIEQRKIDTDFYKTLKNSQNSAAFNDLEIISFSIKTKFEPNIFTPGIILKGWRLIEDVSAKLIEIYENTVVLECLIDKENHVYQEREFGNHLFEGYSLKVGQLFKISRYIRNNQEMIEVKDNPKLVLETDFPQIDFAKKFGNMVLKKK